MGEGEEEYNEIRPQDDCRPPPPLLLRERGDGRKEERGLSKRHNKIIYVVRKCGQGAERAGSERRGEERRGIANAMRGPIYAGRKQTLWQAGTVGDDDVHSGLGFWVKLIDFSPN